MNSSNSSAAPPAAAPPAADGDEFNDGFDVTAPPVLHGVPFAGRARFSVLSHLRAAHSSGGGLFGFMTMRESNKLRVQCREARAEVAAFEWAVDCSGACGLWACRACAHGGAYVHSNFDRLSVEPFQFCETCERGFCEGCAEDHISICDGDECARVFCNECMDITFCDECARGFCFAGYPRCCWHGGYCTTCNIFLCMKSPCAAYVYYCGVPDCFDSACSNCHAFRSCETCYESFCADHALNMQSCDTCYATFCEGCGHTCGPR